MSYCPFGENKGFNIIAENEVISELGNQNNPSLYDKSNTLGIHVDL